MPLPELENRRRHADDADAADAKLPPFVSGNLHWTLKSIIVCRKRINIGRADGADGADANPASLEVRLAPLPSRAGMTEIRATRRRQARGLGYLNVAGGRPPGVSVSAKGWVAIAPPLCYAHGCICTRSDAAGLRNRKSQECAPC